MTSLDLLPYACFECAALVKNAYFFREKCMAGETALYSVMDSMGMVCCYYDITTQSDSYFQKLVIPSSAELETKSFDYKILILGLILLFV